MAPDENPIPCRDPRAERSRCAALAAARELLLDEGWEAVTHARVAERAGMARTTVYRHWPDATDLVLDALAEEKSERHPRPTGVLRDDLVADLDAFRLQLRDPRIERVMVTIIERSAVDEEFGAARASLARQGTRPLAEILRAAIGRGELPACLDIDRVVEQLCGPMLFRHLVLRKPVTKRYVEVLVDDVLRAHTV